MEQITCVIIGLATLLHPTDESHTHTPTLDDYEQALHRMQMWSENVDNPKFYKDIIFRKGDETFKLTELSSFKQNLFLLYQAETLSNQLELLEKAWKLELKKTSTKERKTEIRKYLNKLHKLRKIHAAKFEKFAISVFNKFEDRIPRKDRKEYIRKIRKWHDEKELIEQD